MERIRILVDAHVFDGKFQGSRTYLKGLYQNLVLLIEKHDAPIHLFFAANNPVALEKVFGSRAFISYIRLPASGRLARLGLHYPYLLWKYRIDIAHFQYLIPFYPFCKYINTIHDLLFLEFPQYFEPGYINSRKALFRLSYQYSDVLLTVSTYSQQQIIKHYGRKHQVHVVANGIEEEFKSYTPNPISTWRSLLEKRPYLLCISRFEPRKNQLALLKAYVDLKCYEKYDLVFIGARSEPYSVFDKYATALLPDIKQQVLFFDKGMPLQELMDAINYCSVFIYPSLAEGFGIPPLEAAVLGAPVICGKRTALADFDFFEPYRFDENEPDGLKSTLEKMLADLPLKTERNQLIKQQVLARYHWQNEAEKFLRLLLH